MNNYSTYDITLASVLVSLGEPLKRLDKTNPRKALFIFDKTENLTKHLEDYWTKSLLIEPQLLISSLKTIKTRLYSEML